MRERERERERERKRETVSEILLRSNSYSVYFAHTIHFPFISLSPMLPEGHKREGPYPIALETKGENGRSTYSNNSLTYKRNELLKKIKIIMKKFDVGKKQNMNKNKR